MEILGFRLLRVPQKEWAEKKVKMNDEKERVSTLLVYQMSEFPIQSSFYVSRIGRSLSFFGIYKR